MLHVIESTKSLDHEDGGLTRLATIRPTTMISLYEATGLTNVAEEVERTLVTIMAEAARGPGA